MPTYRDIADRIRYTHNSNDADRYERAIQRDGHHRYGEVWSESRAEDGAGHELGRLAREAYRDLEYAQERERRAEEDRRRHEQEMEAARRREYLEAEWAREREDMEAQQCDEDPAYAWDEPGDVTNADPGVGGCPCNGEGQEP